MSGDALQRMREREYPWMDAGDTLYLNAASIGPLPARTVRAVNEFTSLRAEPHRLSEEMLFGATIRARELCARLFGAEEGSIALMLNTGYGINLAARALPLGAGDVVVIPDREFPANVYPWMALRSKNVEVRIVPTVDSLPDEDALIEALDGPGVRVLSVSWVSFASGYRCDLERLGNACRERGIWFVVDGIQGAGALPINLSALPIDIFASGAQKWLLSPWGTGFCYVAPHLVQQLEPEAVGWLSVRGADDLTRLLDYELAYRNDARRFEMLTYPYQDFAGMCTSMEMFLELGMDAVGMRVEELASTIIDWCDTRPDTVLVTPRDPGKRAGIVSVTVTNAADYSRRLSEAGVVHSLREGAIRFSPHWYNTPQEIADALA
jgi:cysteine desulfurase / selenocysteine lyase